ncbi:MAG TPA: MbcA/ParS/Xre antitoxin family protein [Candidatus Methylacidiphilales bacterium]|jgi:hypothetical protein|nr:MbcA/ParS/Xre antitoxin family protein [Candidatus Methylacidiphilales bacterium]
MEKKKAVRATPAQPTLRAPMTHSPRPPTKYIRRRKAPVGGSYTPLQTGPGPTKVQEFCQTYGMSRQVLPRLSGFSQRAIDHWAAGKRPSGAANMRLTELERLFEALSKLVAAKSIGPWLNRPNAAFQGSTPLQVIERGEGDRLWRMVYQLESGQPG